MKLMTKQIEKILPDLYHFDTTGKEPVVAVKYFDPTGSWTWYVAEGRKEPGGDWLFWGAVDGFEFEFGYFRLSELLSCKQGLTGLRSLPIERDLYFTPVSLKSLRRTA